MSEWWHDSDEDSSESFSATLTGENWPDENVSCIECGKPTQSHVVVVSFDEESGEPDWADEFIDSRRARRRDDVEDVGETGNIGPEIALDAVCHSCWRDEFSERLPATGAEAVEIAEQFDESELLSATISD